MIMIISTMLKQLPDPFHLLPLGAAVPFRLQAGETLFRNGELSQGCYFLEHGEVRLIRWSRDGGETVIHVARPGETFAEAALFSPAYHCDAVASTGASGQLLRKAAIDSLLGSDAAFVRALTARLARQVQALRRTVEIMGIKPAGERVMAALSQYENAGSGQYENLPPLKTLAAQIGLTHEALYRTIARLVRQGALVKTGRGLVQLPPVDHVRKSD